MVGKVNGGICGADTNGLLPVAAMNARGLCGYGFFCFAKNEEKTAPASPWVQLIDRSYEEMLADVRADDAGFYRGTLVDHSAMDLRALAGRFLTSLTSPEALPWNHKDRDLARFLGLRLLGAEGSPERIWSALMALPEKNPRRQYLEVVGRWSIDAEIIV